jgi:hypothetical protein
LGATGKDSPIKDIRLVISFRSRTKPTKPAGEKCVLLGYWKQGNIIWRISRKTIYLIINEPNHLYRMTIPAMRFRERKLNMLHIDKGVLKVDNSTQNRTNFLKLSENPLSNAQDMLRYIPPVHLVNQVISARLKDFKIKIKQPEVGLLST